MESSHAVCNRLHGRSGSNPTRAAGARGVGALAERRFGLHLELGTPPPATSEPWAPVPCAPVEAAEAAGHGQAPWRGEGRSRRAAAPAESWVCSAVVQGPGCAGSTELNGNSNPHLVPKRRPWSVSGWCPWPVPLSTRGATSRAKSAAPDRPQGARGWQTPDREAVRK